MAGVQERGNLTFRILNEYFTKRDFSLDVSDLNHDLNHWRAFGQKEAVISILCVCHSHVRRQSSNEA